MGKGWSSPLSPPLDLDKTLSQAAGGAAEGVCEQRTMLCTVLQEDWHDRGGRAARKVRARQGDGPEVTLDRPSPSHTFVVCKTKESGHITSPAICSSNAQWGNVAEARRGSGPK